MGEAEGEGEGGGGGRGEVRGKERGLASTNKEGKYIILSFLSSNNNPKKEDQVTQQNNNNNNKKGFYRLLLLPRLPFLLPLLPLILLRLFFTAIAPSDSIYKIKRERASIYAPLPGLLLETSISNSSITSKTVIILLNNGSSIFSFPFRFFRLPGLLLLFLLSFF